MDSLVVIQILVDTNGDVRCPRTQEGDPDFFQRSLDAAQKWHYKPYVLNGEKVIVETRIRFSYKKDNVKVLVPSR